MITTDIEFCVEALTNGELVAFPTETVFGLGARADSALAVDKIFELKQRPKDHPLILHCSNIDIALAISPYIPDYAKSLAENFWPGPMTLIFKRALGDAVNDEAVGGHDTVAVRVPSHKIARALLEPCGFFVAAPSANRFGRVSPTKAEHVVQEFGDDLIVLDGEQSQVGLESTIISCVEDTPSILRFGAITNSDVLRVTNLESKPLTQRIAAPGTLENHYAPSIPLYLVENEAEIDGLTDIEIENASLIGGSESKRPFKLVKMVSTYEQYAHELYDFFRESEKIGCKAIVAIKPIAEGIGSAINDRLVKASNSKEEAK